MNPPHGFGRHALCNLIRREQQLHSLGGAAHHGRGEGVGEQVGPRALPQQVDERLRTDRVAAWKRVFNKQKKAELVLY